MRQILSLSLVISGLALTGTLPIVAQNENPAPSRDRVQVTERPAETNDSRDSMVVSEGTEIVVRTNEAIDSTTANEGQSFSGTVQEAVIDADGKIPIPKGSDARLVVRRASTSGTTGSPQLALGLESINIRGHRYTVNSVDVEQGNDRGIGKNRRTGEYVGGGAVLGTLLGAIAGGGKGAAIGAVAWRCCRRDRPGADQRQGSEDPCRDDPQVSA
ncbi:MAG: hypothetical protein WAQ52_03730 [Terriglobales bacterium]